MDLDDTIKTSYAALDAFAKGDPAPVKLLVEENPNWPVAEDGFLTGPEAEARAWEEDNMSESACEEEEETGGPQ